jgi:glycosyltransferase involved in cell wall biosynthesis
LQPLISIIVPAYDSALILPRAIESILRQNYSNFEIIIVDDHSDDDTRRVVERYVLTDLRVNYYYLAKNSGPASARNTGAALAKGELLAFLDADDEWMPDKLGKQVEFLLKNPGVDVVFTDCINLNTSSRVNRKLSEINGDFLSRLTLCAVIDYPDFFILDGPYRQEMFRKFFILISSVLMRRSGFDRIHGFASNRFGTEDVDFFVRLSSQAKFAYWRQEKVLRYQTDRGISAVSEKWLNELVSYYGMCLSSPEYKDLHEIARYNLLKIYRYLIVFYAMSAMPIRSFKTFKESVKLAFYPRLAIYTIVSFAGPAPFRVGRWFNSLWVRLKLMRMM